VSLTFQHRVVEFGGEPNVSADIPECPLDRMFCQSRFSLLLQITWCHTVASCLKHYAASQRVAGSRSDGVNTFFFFNLPNPSCRIRP
jgi:hypothetical protein